MTGLTAHDDAYVIIAGQTKLTADFYGVLVNDDSESPATVSVGQSTSHGVLSLASDGAFTYTPNQGFTGIDTFTYRATAGSLTSDATATVYVVPVTIDPAKTTLDLLALTAQQQAATLYVAMFGRGPDAEGFNIWANAIGSGTTTYGAAATAFTQSPEAIALYPYLASPQTATDTQVNDFVGALYKNAFGRNPGASESAFWTAQSRAAFSQGPEGVGALIQAVLAGAQNTAMGQDITTLLSKVAVSLEYVLAQGSTDWTMAANGAQAVGLITPVSNQPLSVLAGTANAQRLYSSGSAGAPAPDPIGGTPGPTHSTGPDRAVLAAHDDAFVIVGGQAGLAPTFAGLLVNDVAAAPAMLSLLTDTAHGSLQLAANGTFTYSPDAGFSGIDTFTYRIAAGSLVSDATASIYVVPVTVGATTTLDLLALTPREQVAAMYLAFFGRAADAAGFEFRVAQFNALPQGLGPADLSVAIANSFAGSAEAQALYPLLANPQGVSDAAIAAFVGDVYGNLFNRAPDAGGAAFWAGQIRTALAAGQSLGQVLVDILSGTQNTPAGQDITTVMSKVAVSLEYVLQQETHGTSWILAANGAEAVALVAPVTSEPSTVLAGTANAASLVEASAAGASAPAEPAPGVTGATGAAATARDDAYVIVEGQNLPSPAVTGVLANDVSVSPGTASLLTGTAHGSVYLAGNGSFTYTPTVGFAGVDRFTYRVSAGAQVSDATATIYVVPVTVGSTTTLDLLALTPQEQVAAMYLAFFGRAADAAGFEFRIAQFNALPQGLGPADLSVAIANSFAGSAEAQALYPLLANPQGASDAAIAAFVGDVYGNLFNRAPDAGGAAFWAGQIRTALAAGQPLGQVLVDLMSGTRNTPAGQDITTMLSKVAVSLEYVAQQEAHGASWTLAADGAAARALVAQVTSEPSTVLAGTANAASLVEASVAGASATSVSVTSGNVLSAPDPEEGLQFLGARQDGLPGVVQVVQPGADIRQPFDMSKGDQIDLTGVLAGAALAHDLTNISDFVKVTGYGPNDPGFAAGTRTTLEIVGPNGSATITLEGSGKLTTDSLLKSNSLILPPH